MKSIFKEIIFKKGYLFLISAWIFTLGFVITNYWAFNSSPEKVQSKLERQVKQRENLFFGLLRDSSLMYNILEPAKRQTTNFRTWPIGIFSFEIKNNNVPEPVYWNNSSIYLSDDNLKLPDGVYPLKLRNGIFEYIRQSVEYQNKNYIVVAVIPVYWQYNENNAILKSHFDGFPTFSDKYTIADIGYPIHNTRGATLCRIIEKRALDLNFTNTPLTVGLNVLSLLFFLAFLDGSLHIVSREKGRIRGFIALLCVIAIIQTLKQLNIFPFNFKDSELFDPYYYASSALNASLGDLLFNAYFILWIVSYLKYIVKVWNSKTLLRILHKRSYLISVLGLILYSALILWYNNLFRSLMMDSQVPMNILNIFSLNIYSYITLLIAAILILGFFNICYIVLSPAILSGKSMIFQVLIVIACISLFTFTMGRREDIMSNLLFGVVYCALLILFNLREKDLSKPIYGHGFFLIWLTLLSFSAAIPLTFESVKKDIIHQKSIAQKLYDKHLETESSTLMTTIENFNENTKQLTFAHLENSQYNHGFKDSISNYYLNQYPNMYSGIAYSYDKNGTALYNEDNKSIKDLNNIINNYGISTSISGLYTLGIAYKSYDYAYKKVFTDAANDTLGYLFFLVQQKKPRSNSFYSKMFNNSDEDFINPNWNFAYAIYYDNALVKSENNYPFSDKINSAMLPNRAFEVVESNTSTEVWYKSDKNKVIVIINIVNKFAYFLTLGAFIFISALCMIFYILIVGFMQRTNLKRIILRKEFQFTINTRIQVAIISICFLAFFIICISMISYFINNFNKTNQDKLSMAMHTFGRESELALSDINSFDEIFTAGATGQLPENEQVKKDLFSITQINNIDLNIFDTLGQLKFSTQPYLYDREILSHYMDPLAYQNLKYNNRIEYIQNEHIGDYTYMSIYHPIYSQKKTKIGFLNIPNLNIKNEVQDEIASLITVIINLVVLIIFLGGVIAVYLTQRITHSFELIISKMKAINIGQDNDLIEWDRKDEIGALVKEYNIMVVKLADSVKALAKTEREGAWQEMARQVAHEIKNPLTPMKLSIQYLHNAIKNNAPNVRELSDKVSKTLVEQIDQLASIASDFSQFANINRVNLEQFSIADSIQNLAIMYNADEAININIENIADNDIIYADKIQINRVFTNLFKNAIEASDKEQKVKIDVRLHNDQNNIIIDVRDYGSGIPKDRLDKIFVPNFTTKSSGTGLGLAICKGICTHANGSIQVHSLLNQGTTFTVSFPVVQTRNKISENENETSSSIQ